MVSQSQYHVISLPEFPLTRTAIPILAYLQKIPSDTWNLPLLSKLYGPNLGMILLESLGTAPLLQNTVLALDHARSACYDLCSVLCSE